jgi:hypothetical protein
LVLPMLVLLLLLLLCLPPEGSAWRLCPLSQCPPSPC